MSANLVPCPEQGCAGYLSLVWTPALMLTRQEVAQPVGRLEIDDTDYHDAEWQVECWSGHVVLEPDVGCVDGTVFDAEDRARLREVLAAGGAR